MEQLCEIWGGTVEDGRRNDSTEFRLSSCCCGGAPLLFFWVTSKLRVCTTSNVKILVHVQNSDMKSVNVQVHYWQSLCMYKKINCTCTCTNHCQLCACTCPLFLLCTRTTSSNACTDLLYIYVYKHVNGDSVHVHVQRVAMALIYL